MDARIDVFAVLGLHLGEAHVIRNAGGRVTEDVLRSLALSSGVLGVDTAVVMQHTKCGLAGVSDAELREITGADLGFFPIDDHAAALREDVDILARTPYLVASGHRRPRLRRRERRARATSSAGSGPAEPARVRAGRRPGHLRRVARKGRDVQFSDIFDQINAYADGALRNTVHPDASADSPSRP